MNCTQTFFFFFIVLARNLHLKAQTKQKYHFSLINGVSQLVCTLVFRKIKFHGEELTSPENVDSTSCRHKQRQLSIMNDSSYFF